MGLLLRIIRIVISVTAFAILTGSLTFASATIPVVSDFLCRIQLIPAALTFSVAIFVGWLIITLLFGRIYCSTVCPMGTFQDIFSRIPRIGRKKSRYDYHYAPALPLLRYSALAIVAGSMLCGYSALLRLTDPFTIYDNFCSQVILPALTMTAASASGATISLIIICIIAWFAARSGRTLCNTICPVGTTLGFPARYSIFHIEINPDKCIQCRRCEHSCKSSCIDVTAHTVDASRCVVCFDCLPDCPNDAIRYTSTRHQLSYPLMQSIDGAVTSASATPNDNNTVVSSSKSHEHETVS